ncbi:hypothetical protein Vadar_005888 [Vaccinium darrowii]|uniref:Uncharacterized protein n=1 Tax=Vaccinium darrowii TaxID=229202 RepID=A0ACB7XX05_9ERIC|nr:hypothetical protein Vadar_005888 [Vaccinium darrowii]
MSVTSGELDCPLKLPDLPIAIFGLCDGLVCIGNSREVFIWNPSTRKYKGLQDVYSPHLCFVQRFGFGYDESIDDYKVVGFFVDDHTRGSESKVKVHAYTLRSNSWRRIGDCPHYLPPHALGTFVNGPFHWIHLSAIDESNDIIVSLDWEKETYGDGCFDLLLGVLNGCLCVLCNYLEVCFDVWVMKEYGIRDSWTKLFVIPYMSHPPSCPYSAALCILESGEILQDRVTHLVRYNPKDGTFSYPVIHNCSPCFRAHVYIESLVSPDSNADSGV